MIRFAPTARVVALSIVLLGSMLGCGGSSGDGYKGAYGQVSGTVKYQGKPIPAGSTVLFQSKEGASFVASGTVGADGKYDLRYQGSASLPAVAYVVQLAQPAATAAPGGAVDPSKMADGQALLNAGNKAPFPVKYLSTGTSNLSFPVKEGKNTADFDLVD
ncbi:MAG: hypothetical protein JWM11_1405 [Planctomycetaceae bacterium]|nr:hypothetical protein [Planctomycetaceae bacterium]